jgi:hypothetical protein
MFDGGSEHGGLLIGSQRASGKSGRVPFRRQTSGPVFHLIQSKPHAYFTLMTRRDRRNKMLYNLLRNVRYRSNGLNDMNKFKFLLPAALCCALLLSAPARAAEDPSHFQLSAALMDKLKSAKADMKALQ